MYCNKCNSKNIIKFGKDRKLKQVYKCKDCAIRFVEIKSPNRLNSTLKKEIVDLRTKGFGPRKIAKLLGIANWETVRYFLKSVSKGV